MAGSINKVILVGNLGADPKVSNTASGTKIVNLNIATSDSWKDIAWLSSTRSLPTSPRDISAKVPKFIWKDSSRPANGKTTTVRKDTRPKSFCKTSAAIWSCWTAEATVCRPAATMFSPALLPTAGTLPRQQLRRIWTTTFRSDENYAKSALRGAFLLN